MVQRGTAMMTRQKTMRADTSKGDTIKGESKGNKGESKGASNGESRAW